MSRVFKKSGGAATSRHDQGFAQSSWLHGGGYSGVIYDYSLGNYQSYLCKHVEANCLSLCIGVG